MPGYSGTPLPQKLGIKAASRVGLVNAPPGFERTLGPLLPTGVKASNATRGATQLDVIICFAGSRAELGRWVPRAQKRLDPSGGLWVCWPKRASGVVTDLTETEVRTLGLKLGLVDNKVCAVDEVWSGLRLVVRLADRPKASQKPRSARAETSEKTANGNARRATAK